MTRDRHISFVGANEDLQLLESAVPNAPEGGVVVRVTMAGICGSDVHRLTGDVPRPPYPVSFGHEPVGVVEELGTGVTTDWAGTPLRVGDKVWWMPGEACHRCYACTTLQNETLCENWNWPAPSDVPNPAGFRDYATLNPRVSFYRVPDGTPDEAVVALGCALPTALGILDRLGRIEPGQNVVIQGSGPVGLAAALLVGRSVAHRIVMIGALESRLAWGKRFGVHETIDLESTTVEERRERVADLTDGRGADIVIEAAGNVHAFSEGIDMLGLHGRYVIAGLYSGATTVPFNPVVANNKNLTIIGSLYGRASHRHEAVTLIGELHESYHLADLVSHRFPLEKTQEAIHTSGSGEASKVVVVPAMAA